ncbi:D-2-hydroxyacid dehydrogenase [Xylophilus sp.]|uniref:D-2-hydroxyacid dehydrogenase n=1 Tax=Xylophilus sp. TaxID=2653893 RepID=UPI002D80D74A|nr:D-2-hydroxyacid dehydrogenase [Xylophilus sp.]
MTGPAVRLLLSDAARERLAARLGPEVLAVPPEAASAGAAFDIAFVSRDVTGLSTKHDILPDTRRFYDAMLAMPALRWVHVHSAGADRQVFVDLRARGVQVSTSAGSNAAVVAQTALAGLLALARQFPRLLAAQREARWAPLIGSGLPRDLAGQTAVVVGWGAIGRQLGGWLAVLGLKVVAVRRERGSADGAVETAAYDDLPSVLPRADWLVLACPLTARTRGLVDAAALARLPAGAHLVNVARGEVVDEPALVAALQQGRLAGAYLDVFAHEPLPAASPLWRLPNVIATPHSAGFSDGHAARVDAMFLDNLARWQAGQPLANVAA